MILSLLLSCADAPVGVTEPLEGPLLARRLSLDLRGVPPTEAEIDAAEGGEVAIRALRDAWMHDPRFEDRLVSLYAERWWTLVDVFDIVYQDYQLSSEQEFTFERAVGEEPLRLMAHVAANDLPWSEIVTADYTMANDDLLSLWPLDSDGGEGWRRATYTDGRPGVGVLSTNGLWWRYTTNYSNLNRTRAAAISRLLLCEDVLSRPVSFAEATGTVDAEAISTDPYCLACHASLDPLAAGLFGFWWVSLYSEPEETRYHPERERMWEDFLGVEPAWYGEPMVGLTDLGYLVAEDSRFTACAVETAIEMLWRREPSLEEGALAESLREGFLSSGMRMRPLLAAITETDAYRAGSLSELADDEDAAREHTARMMSPAQLATSIESLTGFQWTWNGFEQLGNDDIGYRILAGGVDGLTVMTPQREPGLTWELVVKRLAEAAAQHVVAHDLDAGPDARMLLTMDDPSLAPSTAEWRDQASQLHRRLYAERASDDWLDAIGALWSQIEAEHGHATAWETTIAVMLRDPKFLFY